MKKKLTTDNRQLTTRRKPLVSVIMPVYNGSRFVGKAIESILTQTYPRWELLIADSGSDDDTWKILKRYKKLAPRKIRLFRLHKNGGPSSTSNYLYQFARGAYIAPMDADDVSHRKRLTKEVTFLETHEDVMLVGSNVKVIDAKGKITGYKHCPVDHDNIAKRMAFVNPIVHPSVMIRRSMLPKRDYLYFTAYGVNSDYYTFFEWLKCGKFAGIPEYLLSYRVHDHNSSLLHLKSKFMTITKARLDAVTKLGYHAPVLMFPAILLQALIVTILPESWLKELFFYLRGVKKPKFKLPPFSFTVTIAKMKEYAPSFR
ncbi:glycosyltransferase [Patescibacteria group bacterium]|nr:glycosyltransferase [Patescibacteria group bacterium]MBU1472550.1 glycosyltransferase [Patescibacteria group bacterium]MBU2460076.1 glycosyltransferase [Patescibacteria group bacterium]MBU2544645.1 glycosyltransferase [Patescibacteria group bacterium]